MRIKADPCSPTSDRRRPDPQRAIAAWHPRRAALSLIELVMVVAVAGIFAAVAVPKYLNSLTFYRVESAARRVKADLETARQTARVASATQTVTFSGNSYTMSAGVTGLNNPTGAYTVNLSAAPYQVTSVTANFNDTPTISFNGYGTPTSGGTVIVAAPNCQSTVTLDATTGLITITRSNVGNRATE